MSHQFINPTGAVIPGVSQAVMVEGGRLMFLSGHVPLGPDGKVAGHTLEGQLEQVFENLAATLREAKATFAHLVRVTIYVRDYEPSQLAVIRAVRDRRLGPNAPASALIGVAALFDPDVLVEVDAVAAVG